MRVINFKPFPASRQSITLDGVNLHIVLRWNSRAEFWVLDIYNEDNKLLIGGIKLVVNYEVFSLHKGINLPKGQLYIVDTSSDHRRIGYQDFINERNLQLIYLQEDELVL